MQEAWVQSLGRKDPLDQEDSMEKEMATHSSVLAWKVSWTEEPGGLYYMGSQKSGTLVSDSARTEPVKFSANLRWSHWPPFSIQRARIFFPVHFQQLRICYTLHFLSSPCCFWLVGWLVLCLTIRRLRFLHVPGKHKLSSYSSSQAL